MEDELGYVYDSSLLLCQVTMGDPPNESEKNSAPSDKKNSEKDVDSNPEGKLSPLVKIHACDHPGCNAKFDRPWKLSAHRCIHTGERPFKCTSAGCSKSYTNMTHLRRHLQSHHVEKPTTAPDGTPIPPKFFLCGVPGCEQKFRSKFSIKKHIFRKHNDKRKDLVKCPDCDLVFKKHHQLKTHMYTHDGIKPFKCEWCNCCFVNHNDILKHVRKHKLYKCSYSDCPDGKDKIFANRNEYRTHVAHVHPSSFTCEYCGKLFALRCRLNTHKMSCGSDKNSKPFKCIMDDCDHVFKLHRNMLQHVKHKHGEPRFTCTVDNCGKKFIWKISFNKHLRTFHSPTSMQARKLELEKMDLDIPKQRKKRKDANIPKLLSAEALSGVIVDKVTQMELLKKDDVEFYDQFMAYTVKYISDDNKLRGKSDENDKDDEYENEKDDEDENEKEKDDEDEDDNENDDYDDQMDDNEDKIETCGMEQNLPSVSSNSSDQQYLNNENIADDDSLPKEKDQLESKVEADNNLTNNSKS